MRGACPRRTLSGTHPAPPGETAEPGDRAIAILPRGRGLVSTQAIPQTANEEAEELFEFVTSAVEAGHVSRIILDASDAGLVTLEGVGVLIRLRAWARGEDTELRLAPVNPRLGRKLRETGTAGLFWTAASAT